MKLADDEWRRLLLVTHSSRPVEIEHCGLNTLTRRYQHLDRLESLPPFEELPGLDEGFRSYRGSLSIHHVVSRGGEVETDLLAWYEPGGKIQHAAVVGSRLVVCFEDHLEILDGWWCDGTVHLDGARTSTITDPWFGGLHTVFAVGGDTCIVSAAASDAALVVDLERRVVTRRLRLPSDLYGRNYDLTPDQSVVDHYITNDIQVGHLNCAVPDGAGTILVSSLIPGDVGRFDAAGRYEILCTGIVGLHGARPHPADARLVYYADSCAGLFVVIDRAGRIRRRWSADSVWLHDVQHIANDVYALAVADRNVVSLVEPMVGVERGEISFPDHDGSVQFLSVADPPWR